MKNNVVGKWKFLTAAIVIIVAWFAMAAISGPYFGKIGEQSSSTLEGFLPKNAESFVVNEKLKEFLGKRSLPLVVVYENSGKEISDDDLSKLKAVNEDLAKVDGVAGAISPPIKSEDKKAAMTIIPLKSDGKYKTIFPVIKDKLNAAKLPANYTLTGPASFTYDLQKGFSGIDTTLLLVTMSCVFLILIAVYRSPFLPFIVLGSAAAALAVAVFTVYYAADSGIVQLNQQVQGILFILVIGAATDYALLYIARYREELTDHVTAWEATVAALKSSYLSIVAAGGTVTVGLLCLLASELGSNRALGPVGGIGIILSVLASLTLLPALLLLFGRTAFWPRKPKYTSEKSELHYTKNHPAWAKVGAFVRRHPRRIWAGCTVILVIAFMAISQLKASGVPQSSIVLGESEARDGQALLDKHFPSGSGTPAYILVEQSKKAAVVETLYKDKGVSSVSISTSGPMTAMPIGKAEEKAVQQTTDAIKQQHEGMLKDLRKSIEKQLQGQPQSAIDTAYAEAAKKIPSVDSLVNLVLHPEQKNPSQPKVIDDKVLLMATLTDPADSLAARDTIERVRTEVRKVDNATLVGGTSALQLDTNTASQKDLQIIIPLILISITVILMLLLRAIVAPIILLVSTILSFGATMGISALMFNHVWNFPGADPTVLIMAFVFLVALGIDYNIFLMTRVREETIKSGVAKGTIKGLVVTGGVITSAGIVLAATFASLGVIPILFLAQIAFIVTFGVLLDTLIVRSLLIPAITLEIGKRIWWPSRLSRSDASTKPGDNEL